MIQSVKRDFSNILHRYVLKNITGIPEKDLFVLTDRFIEKKYLRNEMLVMAGDKWDRVFFVHQGIARVYYTDTEGREHNKGFYWENRLLWPVAPSVRNRVIRFSISAVEDVLVSACDFSFFYSWFKQHGIWEQFALPYLESFLEDKFNREYEFLMNPAVKRFKQFCREYPELVHRIPDYHLASYLGITNVSLSRIKKNTDFNLC